MARKLKNWIESYEQYAKDAYCPDEFHLWTGLTVLAAALERKVWLLNGKIYFYPNIYTMLTTYAGVGKSTAIVRGADLLERLKHEFNPEFKIIAEQITEPGLVKVMEIRQEMAISETKRVFHSSGFFYASEASASALQNTHGTFTSTITAMYDCPKVFRKVTKGESERPTEIHNVCLNMLAGATFDYLKNLVNESSVMGGFASRIIYVINKERIIREPKWGQSEFVDQSLQEDLFQDLCEIHKLMGRFRPTPAFIKAWEDFQPESDRKLKALNSPALESLAARMSTNTTKIAMLLSIAESNDLVVDLPHWERAMEMIETVSKDNAFILSQGAMADRNSQSGMNQVIGQTLAKLGGEATVKTLRRVALTHGIDADKMMRTIDAMASADLISIDSNGVAKLVVDPYRYL